MGDFAGLLAVLANNQKDVEEMVTKFGLGNIIRAAPNLIHIMQTLAAHRDPVAATERVSRVLAYNDETMDKVKAFQSAHGLIPDGIIGNRTWNMVEALIRKPK